MSRKIRRLILRFTIALCSHFEFHPADDININYAYRQSIVPNEIEITFRYLYDLISDILSRYSPPNPQHKITLRQTLSLITSLIRTLPDYPLRYSIKSGSRRVLSSQTLTATVVKVTRAPRPPVLETLLRVSHRVCVARTGFTRGGGTGGCVCANRYPYFLFSACNLPDKTESITEA